MAHTHVESLYANAIPIQVLVTLDKQSQQHHTKGLQALPRQHQTTPPTSVGGPLQPEGGAGGPGL